MTNTSRWGLEPIVALVLLGAVATASCAPGSGDTAKTPAPQAKTAPSGQTAETPTPDRNLIAFSWEGPSAPGLASKEFPISSDRANQVQAIRIRGRVTNPTISIGNSSVTLPVELSSGDEINVTFDAKSTITLARLAESYDQDALEQKNVILKTAVDPRMKWLELENTLGDFLTRYEGYVIYKVTSPYPLSGLTVVSYPRVYNDADKLNSVSLLYSPDGTNYTPVYKVASNGNAVDVTPLEAKSNTLTASGNSVYIKFLFEGHGNPQATEYPTTVQLWSTTERPMILNAKFDTSALSKMALQSGSNTVKFSAEKAQGKIDLSLVLSAPAGKK